MIISFVASTDLGMQFPHVAPADPLPDMIDNVNRQTNGRTDAHENKKCPAGLVTGKLLDACKKHGCYGEQSEAKNLQTSHGSGCSITMQVYGALTEYVHELVRRTYTVGNF